MTYNAVSIINRIFKKSCFIFLLKMFQRHIIRLMAAKCKQRCKKWFFFILNLIVKAINHILVMHTP